MTVEKAARYFADRGLFPDPKQKVRFALSPDDVPIEKGARLEVRGTVIPERGVITVGLRPVTIRKWMFSLKFEANPVIEAPTIEEAEAKAYEMLRDVAVTKVDRDGEHFMQHDYVAQEPLFLEEVKEQ